LWHTGWGCFAAAAAAAASDASGGCRLHHKSHLQLLRLYHLLVVQYANRGRMMKHCRDNCRQLLLRQLQAAPIKAWA
jgi:hypothetical protein